VSPLILWYNIPCSTTNILIHIETELDDYMPKANEVVRKETGYIAFCTVVLSTLMQIIFLIAGSWTYKVILGNLLSSAVMIANFYFMGLTVQKAVMQDEKEAKKTVKVSQSLRTFSVFVFVVIGVALPCFSTIATIIPIFFTRIAVALRPLIIKNR